MKTEEEIKWEILDINDQLFLIDMVDHWEEQDRKSWEELTERKKKLEKELEKIENEGK